MVRGRAAQMVASSTKRAHVAGRVVISEEARASVGNASVGRIVMRFYACAACRCLAAWTIVAALTTPIEDDLLEPLGRREHECDGDGTERWDTLRSASHPRQLWCRLLAERRLSRARIALLRRSLRLVLLIHEQPPSDNSLVATVADGGSIPASMGDSYMSKRTVLWQNTRGYYDYFS
jgi:hypothetical protein